MTRPLAVLVLAAGLGKRTKLSLPKVLLPLCGRTLLGTVLDELAVVGPDRTIVVLHHGKGLVEESLAGRDGLTIVDQGSPRGTGHAVQVAMEALGDFHGDVLVCYGDMPLMTRETLMAFVDTHDAAAASLITAILDDPSGLGRILRDEDGNLLGIREERDCEVDELAIDEVNVGVYCFDAAALRKALAGLSAQNAQGELYLTDTIGNLLMDKRLQVDTVLLDDVDEALGVNSLQQLAIARAVMQDRILETHLSNGVLVEDPASTWIDHGVVIGKDTRILPCCVIRTGVVIGEGCEVGPFAHLREGTVLEDGAQIGNFVEVKQSRVGKRSKAKHLSYLGDAEIGEGANIGAGTITANYDGKQKHKTVIEDGAFVGSGSVLVAPVRVGKRAYTGAGAIVTRNSNVGDGETWVGVPARRIDRSRDAGGTAKHRGGERS